MIDNLIRFRVSFLTFISPGQYGGNLADSILQDSVPDTSKLWLYIPLIVEISQGRLPFWCMKVSQEERGNFWCRFLSNTKQGIGRNISNVFTQWLRIYLSIDKTRAIKWWLFNDRPVNFWAL